MRLHSKSPQFLSAAERIADRLVASARWQGDQCTWTGAETRRQERNSDNLVGPTLYGGTAGISLFLAELFRFVPKGVYRRAALGGLRNALLHGNRLPAVAFGYHSGRTGIGHAGVRIARLLACDAVLGDVSALLQPLLGNESRDAGLDVIAGAAGAIPALLQLGRDLDRPELRDSAQRLGEHLIDRAVHESSGWSWPTTRPPPRRNLCGYAHGAAGISCSLLELYAETGRGHYRFAAEQGFLYERQFYSAERRNWPDLRHQALTDILFQDRLEELRSQLLQGEPPPTAPVTYMTAWCHGAPGIALSRLRAWQLTGDSNYREEAENALDGTLASLDDMRNFSLCHGVAGNCDALLTAAAVLGRADLRDRGEARALQGVIKFEHSGAGWPSGAKGGQADPGLLLGDAGVGLFLLRLVSPDVPSPLLVMGAEPISGTPGAAEYAWSQQGEARRFFGRTLEALNRHGVGTEGAPIEQPIGSDERGSIPQAVFDWLEPLIDALPLSRQWILLADGFALEREAWLLAASVHDFTEEYFDSLRRLNPSEVRWTAVRFQLSERTRVVYTGSPESRSPGGPYASASHGEAWHLLHASAGTVTSLALPPFVALVLTAAGGSTLAGVVRAVQQALGAETESAPEWVEERVVAQLAHAYAHGYLLLERSAASSNTSSTAVEESSLL